MNGITFPKAVESVADGMLGQVVETDAGTGTFRVE